MDNETHDKVQKVTMTLPRVVVMEYKDFCKKNGMSLSKRVALLMKEDLRFEEQNENTINE